VTGAAVVVDGVSKRYRLYHERNQSLKAAIMRRRRSTADEFWALKDVSLEVPTGSTFALVGENGSGKSTLMKCVTRILRPDAGSLKVEGKASALLELGAGFHPELTGRENVYLNGSILGLSRRDINHKFDGIVDFAGLSQFIDQPVKNYSSGMYVRLGFSVAINVDPDVLLVDEVLAVGDEAFQRKCQEKFVDLKAEGKTIVLVSHNLETVQNLCDHAAWLDHGQVKLVDTARRVADEYLSAVQVDRTVDDTADGVPGHARWGSGEARIDDVELLDATGSPLARLHTGQALTVRFHCTFHETVERPVLGIAIHTIEGVVVTGPNARDAGCVPERLSGKGHVDLHIERLMLVPGTYEATVAIHDYAEVHPYDFRHRLLRLEVESGEPRESHGLVSLGGRWEIGAFG